MAGTMLLSTTRCSSHSLCQGQLQDSTVAIQQNVATCIQYKQAKRGEMAELKNKKKELQQTRCVLARNTLLIGVEMTIWRGEAVTVEEVEVLISFGTAAASAD